MGVFVHRLSDCALSDWRRRKYEPGFNRNNSATNYGAVDSIAATTFWLLFMEALTTCEVNLSNELAFVAVKSSTHIEHISRDDIEWVRSIKPRLN